MRKSVFRIVLTLLLAFIIGFSAVPVHTIAASKATSAADQKKIAKKAYKAIKADYEENDDWGVKVKYKKTGKRYTITVTQTSKRMSLDYIRGAAFEGGDNYGAVLKMLTKYNKSDYKLAKKCGLKKPVVYLIWMSSDGQKVATFKNGSME